MKGIGRGARRVWSVLRNGFGKRSLIFLVAVGLLYGVVALCCPFLIDLEAEIDWLLAGIWVLMTVALAWDPRPARDVKLIAVGLVGGLVIEGWGTNTELWRYFTEQRPPPWILPAWPMAAICIDRLSRLLDHLLPALRRAGPAYWLVLPAFIVVFVGLMRPAITHPWSLGVLVLMIVVTYVAARPRRDIVLFVAGASLGIFLEYWGTSRACWTYWNGHTPPVAAVLAHGFASIAFARGVQLLDAVFRRWGVPSLSKARKART